MAPGDHQREEGRLPRALPVPLGGHELNARVLKGWLDDQEVALLRQRSKTLAPWVAGRQGTGYDKALLRDRLDDVEGPLLQRALDEVIGTQPLPDGWQLWDAWLLRYPDGAHIAAHTDPAMDGHRHVRLNALLQAPVEGGELTLGGEVVVLEVGDAIVFAPDAQAHAVSQVRGERLLLSVGAWLPVV